MIRKIIKQEKGITLIALVITIIVLLILAGVAISMLSGENGILIRASEAKEQTEEAQKNEETNLTSMELETYFITNNSKYKCAYGYITGITTGDKVLDLQSELPEGYKVAKRYDYSTKTDKNIQEEEKENLSIETGMTIEKNGKEVARTVIFGEVDGYPGITVNDAQAISRIANNTIEYQDFQKVASDVNHDGIIDAKDGRFLSEQWGTSGEIIQDKYATRADLLKLITNDEAIHSYIENLPKEFKDKYKVDIDEIGYFIKLDNNENVTVGEMLTKLGDGYKEIALNLYNADELTYKSINDKNSSEIVTNNSSIKINFDGIYETTIDIIIE